MKLLKNVVKGFVFVVNCVKEARSLQNDLMFKRRD